MKDLDDLVTFTSRISNSEILIFWSPFISHSQLSRLTFGLTNATATGVFTLFQNEN